jgi:hypothetical protein
MSPSIAGVPAFAMHECANGPLANLVKLLVSLSTKLSIFLVQSPAGER